MTPSSRIGRAHVSSLALALPLLLASISVRPAHASVEETTDDDNFREDVIACEEALGRLASCCPGFDTRAVQCWHYRNERTETGCEGSHSNTSTALDPAISIDSSRCILQTSCEGLRQRGVCERAQHVPTPGSWSRRTEDPSPGSGSTSSSGAVAPRVEVCP